MVDDQFEYAGFISYARIPDRELAGDVHLALERLKRPWYRTRALRIFRDVTSLGAEPDGWGTTLARMDSSEFLILLACPESAASEAVSHLAFSPDGETLASGGDDGTIRLWNAITGASIATLLGQTGPVTALAFNADGVLAAGGHDGVVALWHVPKTSLSDLCTRLGGPITRAEWTADVPGIAYEKVC